MDFSKYYNLEAYLFDEVANNFRSRGYLNADEFYCIIIWKSNRSKTRILKTLGGKMVFAKNVREITSSLFQETDLRSKMEILIKKGFRLPIASAILSVLYPERFSVYDVRVSELIDSKIGSDFQSISGRRFGNMWRGYQAYLQEVLCISGKKTYRDADKFLWGMSFYLQNCEIWTQD